MFTRMKLAISKIQAIKLGWRKVSTLVLICLCVTVATVHLARNKLPLPWMRTDIALFSSNRNTGFVNYDSVNNAKANTSIFLSGNTNRSENRNYKPANNRGTKLSWTVKRRYPQDLMAVGPFKFLQNYKNPCFKTKLGSIACLPYFYLAGAPKSGTTDLSFRINMHPQVTQDVLKEPHWMTRNRFAFKHRTKKFPTIEEYLYIFNRATWSIQRDVKSFYHPTIVGDCSASTLWDNYNLRMLEENQNRTMPLHTVPDFIHHLNPNTKIIIILRNPIDRLYSGYLFFKRVGKTLENFHKGVQEAINYYQDCFRRYTERHCLILPPNKPLVRIYIGLYYYYIADYLRVFPRDQLLVLKMEDYSENMSQNLERVFSFLEIAPLNKTQMANIVGKARVRNSRRPNDRKRGDMLPETRKLLNDFYKPHNEKLEKLLGIKFWE